MNEKYIFFNVSSKLCLVLLALLRNMMKLDLDTLSVSLLAANHSEILSSSLLICNSRDFRFFTTREKTDVISK